MLSYVLNQDCMKYMGDCKDNQFDLAICDPPFGIFSKKSDHFAWSKFGTGGTWVSKYGKKIREWDIKPNVKYFKELLRISNNQIIFGANHFGYEFNNYIVWEKITISEKFSMGMCEMASVSVKGNPKIFKIRPQDSNRFHPTQKPVALYKWLLKNYAEKGDKIFDSHLGSGSSRIAAYEMGFDFVGCELDLDYFNAQEKRFEREKARIDNKFYISNDDNILFRDKE